MAKKLKDLRVDEVSAVDKAANGKRFLILKRHAEGRAPVEKVIKHEGSKWNIYSEKGKRLGSYDTEEAAVKRLRQIEWFKSHPVKKKADGDTEQHQPQQQQETNNGGFEMTVEEIQKAVEQTIEAGLSPIVKRLDALEAAQASEETEPQEPVEKSEEAEGEPLTVEAVTKSVQEAVAEAIKPLQDRLEVVETAAGKRSSGEPEGATPSRPSRPPSPRAPS